MKALFFENRMSRVIALKAASLFSKNAALGPFSTLRFAEISEPELPGQRWLKVRNLACGLCGTDIHFMFMDLDPRSFPAAVPGIEVKYLGHELVGEVVELGAEVNRPELQIGDRVALRIDWPSCFQLEIEPPCRPCAAGNYMLCENLGTRAPALRDTGGGFSPYMVMHRTQPFRIPDALDTDSAVLLEPLASSVHGVLKAEAGSGDKVLVLGAGTIGLLTVAATRALRPGAEVYCLARYPFQAQAARRLGAEVIDEGPELYRRVAERTGARHVTGHLGNQILLGGFDVLYDTVGNDTSLNNALRWVRGGGRVVLLGINFKPGRIDYTTVWNQEIELTGINCHATEAGGESSFEVAARLLMEGAVPTTALLTHRFPLDQWRKAVKTFMDKKRTNAIKVVLDPRNPAGA